MRHSRRQILRLGAGAAAAWCLGSGLRRGEAAANAAKIPIGLELWSVRHQCEKELPSVLAAVADMGYSSVELAHSYYGFEPKEWRELLDKNGLKSCGMHMSLSALQGDALEKTVKIHKIIGSPYLIVASLPKKKLSSVEGIVEVSGEFNEIAKQLEPHGMKVGYHCHGGDFATVDDKIPWVVFGENTSANVILQLDIGNCLGGGGDPIAMLKKFPGRSISVHLKDHGGKPGFVFGEGKVNWSEVFGICESTGGTKQYIIEEEGRQGPESLQVCRHAIQNFKRMGR